MARQYKGWRPTESDLDEYRMLFDAASSAVERASRALSGELALTERQLESILPVIGDPATGDDLATLKLGFANRQEFKRELSYLKRVASSEQTKQGQKFGRMTYEAAGSLTAGRIDPATGEITTQFMERERALTKRRRNDAALKLIREAGIEMERVPVLDENGKQVTDEWRHKVFTYIPATPENERKLRALEEKNPGAQYVPDEAASNMRVRKFGDLTRLGEVQTAKYKPKQIYDSLRTDSITDMKNHLYWANYSNIAQTTMGDGLGAEIARYIDRIQKLGYSDRDRLYRKIEYSDAEYAQLDYVYEDTMGSTSVKLSRMIKFWREEIVPDLDDIEGLEGEERTDTSGLMPVTPSDPAYMHLRDMPPIEDAEPSIWDVYHANAKPRRYRKQNMGKKLAQFATGITLQEIKDIFYSLGTMGM